MLKMVTAIVLLAVALIAITSTSRALLGWQFYPSSNVRARDFCCRFSAFAADGHLQREDALRHGAHWTVLANCQYIGNGTSYELRDESGIIAKTEDESTRSVIKSGCSVRSFLCAKVRKHRARTFPRCYEDVRQKLKFAVIAVGNVCSFSKHQLTAAPDDGERNTGDDQDDSEL